MQESAKILFVDDEKNILKALRRTLLDEDWDCQFALGPREALELLAEETFDLVVSDVMMPDMDGVALLSRVKQEYPGAVRIFLTGFAKKEVVTKALAEGCAQQILPKPWDDEVLKQSIRDALRQSSQQKNYSPNLQLLLNSMTLLPQLPDSCTQVQSCIKGDDTDLEKMAAVVSRDVAISSALLHWANSALFGQKFRVETVQKALVVLGTDIAINLILSMSVNKSIASGLPEMETFDLDKFNQHSIATAVLSRLLLKSLHPDNCELQDRAFIAGLLHDMGKLIAARYFEDKFSAGIALAQEKDCQLIEAELETLGASHDEVGSFLAEWWMLPDFIVNAVRWHHEPLATPADPQIVGAVHVADLLCKCFNFEVAGETSQGEISAQFREIFCLDDERLRYLQTEAESIINGLH